VVIPYLPEETWMVGLALAVVVLAVVIWRGNRSRRRDALRSTDFEAMAGSGPAMVLIPDDPDAPGAGRSRARPILTFLLAALVVGGGFAAEPILSSVLKQGFDLLGPSESTPGATQPSPDPDPLMDGVHDPDSTRMVSTEPDSADSRQLELAEFRQAGDSASLSELADPPSPVEAVEADSDLSVSRSAAATPSPPEEVAARPVEATDPVPGPVRVEFASGRRRFWTGGVQTCRLDDAGEAECWGGSGPTPSLTGLRTDEAPALRSLAVGVMDVCGISAADRVVCWSGQPDRTAPSSLVAVRIPGDAAVVELAVGSEHVCALSRDGTVHCWGSNARGQLGTGTPTAAATPLEVADLPPVVRLTAGWLHTCGLTAQGRAYCWGANDAGQLGNGGSTDRSRATPVDQPEPFVGLAAGSSHTCGLTASGDAWCWGDNAHGQLGVVAGARAVRPARVDGQVAFSSLTAGGVHTCGVTRGGRAWCWGRNTFGQLGDGSMVDSSAPIPVARSVRFAVLTAGGAHTCGATVGGDLYCWGNNIHGQLGDGTRDNRSEPVRVMR
jgi:hypothetical protein